MKLTMGLSKLGAAVTALAWLAFMAAVIMGWWNNLLDLIEMDAFNPEAFVRVVGIFMVPVGVIMGWFF